MALTLIGTGGDTGLSLVISVVEEGSAESYLWRIRLLVGE